MAIWFERIVAENKEKISNTTAVTEFASNQCTRKEGVGLGCWDYLGLNLWSWFVPRTVQPNVCIKCFCKELAAIPSSLNLNRKGRKVNSSLSRIYFFTFTGMSLYEQNNNNKEKHFGAFLKNTIVLMLLHPHLSRGHWNLFSYALCSRSVG